MKRYFFLPFILVLACLPACAAILSPPLPILRNWATTNANPLINSNNLDAATKAQLAAGGAPYQGNVIALTNGVYESATLNNPVMTNGINQGSAFSSPSQSIDSEAFGLGAQALQVQTIAVGQSSLAGGPGDSALGYSAQVFFSATNGVAVGTFATASKNFATAIGPFTSAIHTNSTAVGANAVTTAPDQIMLGSAKTSTFIHSNLTVQGTIYGDGSGLTNVAGAAMSAASINTALGATAVGAATNALNSEPKLNVKTSFGAIGNGIADDTAAIQAAIDFSQYNSNSPSVAYIPPGIYKITSTLVIHTNTIVTYFGYKGFTLQGGGQNSTVIISTMTNAPAIQMVDLNNDLAHEFTDIQMKDMRFLGPDWGSVTVNGTPTNYGNGICSAPGLLIRGGSAPFIYGLLRNSVSRCDFMGFRDGIQATNLVSTDFFQVSTAFNWRSGFLLQFCDGTQLYNCWAGYSPNTNYLAALYVEQATDVQVYGGIYAACKRAYYFDKASVTVIGGNVEANSGTEQALISGNARATFENTRFQGTTLDWWAKTNSVLGSTNQFIFQVTNCPFGGLTVLNCDLNISAGKAFKVTASALPIYLDSAWPYGSNGNTNMLWNQTNWISYAPSTGNGHYNQDYLALGIGQTSKDNSLSLWPSNKLFLGSGEMTLSDLSDQNYSSYIKSRQVTGGTANISLEFGTHWLGWLVDDIASIWMRSDYLSHRMWLGIGTNNPSAPLHVVGNIFSQSGTFIGDGSGLTNIGAATIPSTYLKDGETNHWLKNLSVGMTGSTPRGSGVIVGDLVKGGELALSYANDSGYYHFLHTYTIPGGVNNISMEEGIDWGGSIKTNISIRNNGAGVPANIGFGTNNPQARFHTMGSMLVDGGPFTNTGASYFGSAAQASISAAGVHVGDGSGLTNLTVYGSNIVSGGVLPNGLLSTNSPVNGGFLQETGDKRKLTFDGESLTNLTGGKITGPITNLSNTTLGSAGQTIIDASGNYTSSGSLLAVGGLSGTGGAITNGVLRNTGGTHYLTNDANGFGLDSAPVASYSMYSGGAFAVGRIQQQQTTANTFFRSLILGSTTYTSGNPLLYVTPANVQTVPAFAVDQTNGTRSFTISATNGQVDAYGPVFSTNGISSLSSNLLAIATITVGASPFSWTNTFTKNVYVFVDGGTGTALAINGTTVFTSLTGGHTIPLQPKEYVTSTHTVAPTMFWKPF